MLTKIINTVTNVLFIVSSSLFIFIIVRQGAPGKILPRAANWPGPALTIAIPLLIFIRDCVL